MVGRRIPVIRLLLVPLVLACGFHGFFNEPCLGDARKALGGFWQNWDAWLIYLFETAHRTLRLFVLQLDRGCLPTNLIGDHPPPARPMEDSLQVARFGAMALSAYAVVGLFLPRAVQWARIAAQSLFRRKHRAVILGYGPVGQAIAAQLRSRGRSVTAVHRGVTDALAETARRQRIVLVEGDPSDPAVHGRVWLGWARKVLAATGKDMETLDTAVSAAAAAGATKVCAIVSDPDLATDLAETTARGFLGSASVEPWSLPQEAARLLIAEARFDRDAVETLLTAWRKELGPPAITVLDRKVADVEARFRRRAPALFLEEGEEGALPRAARPVLRFLPFDAETADYGGAEVAALLSDIDRPTAWIFASSDDSLNLRAASALHAAMLKRRLHAAPIHVRIWSGHQGDTPVLTARPIAMARAFGALETTVAATPACENDPDEIARELHQAYCDAGQEMDRTGQPIRFTGEPWDALSETLKNANRNLHRHAVMKIEDLDGQSRASLRAVPVVEENLRETFSNVEKALDYSKVRLDGLDDEWWLDGTPEAVRAEDDRARRLKDVAIVEHNRWTVERALDGWRATAVRDAALRDNERRLHHNMHDWSTLDPVTRRWDAVLLRALVKGEVGRAGSTAWKKKPHTLVLALRSPDAGDPNRPRWLFDDDTIADGQMTELRIVIAGESPPKHRAAQVDGAEALMRELLLRPGVTTCLCRVRFDFNAPPGEGALAIANAMGAVASAWREGRYQHDYARKLGIEVSALWNWSPGDGPDIAFAGHRDPARVGGSAGLEDRLERVFAELVRDGHVGLVTGYAPGADRIAVAAWKRLVGTKPKLVFPFAEPATATTPGRFFTADPATATADETLSAAAAGAIGPARVARRRRGLDPHRAQALELLDSARVLVAVHDGAPSSGKGSVGDTIEAARKRRIKVVVVGRE